MATWAMESGALVRRDRKCKLVVVPRAHLGRARRKSRAKPRIPSAGPPTGPADWRVICEGELEERGSAASVTAAKTRAAKAGKNLNQLYALIRTTR